MIEKAHGSVSATNSGKVCRLRLSFTAHRSQRISIVQFTHPMVIEVLQEIPEFSFKARGFPEQSVIKNWRMNPINRLMKGSGVKAVCVNTHQRA